MKSFLLLLIGMLLLSAAAQADTVILRDGRRVEGQLISIQSGVVEFLENRGFGGSTLVRINQNQVNAIQFDQNRNVTNAPTGGAPRRRPAGLRERQVMVAANAPWTDSGIDVQSGQDIYFEAIGEINWGPGRRHSAAGEPGSPMNANRPLPNRPAAALIGRVGDNAADSFLIGAEQGAIRMRSSGRLLLGVNDDHFADNSGSFRVVVYY